MYSLVIMAAMTAAPDVPQALLCPVTPSNYGSSFWLKNNFFECCAPARYGWVNCWNKGFGYYPGGGRSFVGCCATYGHFYQPTICGTCSTGKCSTGGGGGFCSHDWCGRDWSIGNQPAWYASPCGTGPCQTAAPYARYTERCPCSTYGHFAFDSGLIGHSSGVGYAGFGGYGNFGFYGAVPMQHPPTTADIPRFVAPPNPDGPPPGMVPFGTPGYGAPGSSVPLGPMGPPRIPPTNIPIGPNPGGTITPMVPNPGSLNPPENLLPKPPTFPPVPLPDIPGDKKEPRKVNTPRNLQSTVVLNVPAGAKVFVETQMLKGEAEERTFRTPNLQPGQEYVYTVKAYITVGSSEFEETQKVTVKAGEITRASFDQLIAKVQSTKPSVVGVGARK